ncbi:MAG: AI-2E family transporter [Gemmatimonadaceae bacterium]
MPSREQNHDDSLMAPQVDAGAQAKRPPDEPTPDLTKLGDTVMHHQGARSIAMTGLFVLAVFATLYLGRDVFLPLALALLFNFLFSPLIRALRRLRVPAPAGALVVVVGLVGLIVLAGYELITPAEQWLARAPATMNTVSAKLRNIRRPVEQMTRTAEEVAQATSGAPTPEPPTPVVVAQGESIGEKVFGTTQSIVVGLLEMLILLYFLLAAGDMFLQKLIKVLPQFRDKKKAVEIARAVEVSVSTYLVTIAMVNAIEGVVVALVMLAIGMPNALLWGVLTTLLEFVPYVGAVAMTGVLTVGGLAAFPDIGHALAVPGAFLTINLLQANFVSPLVLGRRLTLNPVAILIGLMIWYELWGVAGAFIAVPLLATFKILCDHIETLAPVGEFLGKK